jgi:hypothetical protein
MTKAYSVDSVRNRFSTVFVWFTDLLNKQDYLPNPNGEALAEGKPETSNFKPETLSTWILSFPEGWGAPPSLEIEELKAWKDLDISDEAKAFSGTVTYTTTFEVSEIRKGTCFTLDLGRVDMIAAVSLNGKPISTLWTPPYCVDLTEAIRTGDNELIVEVTGTWFNRLVYDAGLPEEQRKTWTIGGPSKDETLRESGLLGPVLITVQ